MFKYGMSGIKWGHTLNDNRFQVMSLQEPPSQISFIIKQISGEESFVTTYFVFDTIG